MEGKSFPINRFFCSLPLRERETNRYRRQVILEFPNKECVETEATTTASLIHATSRKSAVTVLHMLSYWTKVCSVFAYPTKVAVIFCHCCVYIDSRELYLQYHPITYTLKISRQHPFPSHTETDHDDNPLPWSLPSVGGVHSLCRSALSLHRRRQMLSAFTNVAIPQIAFTVQA